MRRQSARNTGHAADELLLAWRLGAVGAAETAGLCICRLACGFAFWACVSVLWARGLFSLRFGNSLFHRRNRGLAPPTGSAVVTTALDSEDGEQRTS